MSNYMPTDCAGCPAQIEPEVGRYYCDGCIAAQTEAYALEAQAFDDFHAFADRVAILPRSPGLGALDNGGETPDTETVNNAHNR